MVLFCAMPGSTANRSSATAPGALAVLLLFFHVKGNSDPEVVSVLHSDGWDCESR